MSFYRCDNYISHQEAADVLKFVQELFPVSAKDRSVRRFGLTNSYASDKVSAEIPPVLQYLIDKLVSDEYVRNIRHVTVNRYEPGQTIPFHIDSKEAGDMITIISLNSDCVMLFKEGNRTTQEYVPANSLVQFDGAERWEKKHSIEPVKDLRYSIVFRKH